MKHIEEDEKEVYTELRNCGIVEPAVLLLEVYGSSPVYEISKHIQS